MKHIFNAFKNYPIFTFLCVSIVVSAISSTLQKVRGGASHAV